MSILSTLTGNPLHGPRKLMRKLSERFLLKSAVFRDAVRQSSLDDSNGLVTFCPDATGLCDNPHSANSKVASNIAASAI